MQAKAPAASNIAIEFIKQKIETLNWIIVLSLFVTLLFVVRFLYNFLDFIPLNSVILIMVIMAGLAVIVIYLAKATSARAIQAIDEYSWKLSTLLGTISDMNKIGYEDVLLENIMEAAMVITRADAGAVVMREGGTLVYKAAKGGLEESLRGESMPASRGVVGWAVEAGEPVLANDVASDTSLFPKMDEGLPPDTRSALAVPLSFDGTVLGALVLTSRSAGAFTGEDEEVMTHFAGQAAASLEKTSSYEVKKNYEIHMTNILVSAIENLSEKEGHAKRVARYTLAMAGGLGLPEAEKKLLYQASMLHDIGFLKINMRTVTQVEEYQLHARYGYEILKPITFYADLLPVVLHHHERYDGEGYPDRLKGDAIPLEARMVAIAEAFDVMVSAKSYKNVGRMINDAVMARTVNFARAVEELRANAGTQFDPMLVDVFLRNMSEEDLIE
ncbi:MAG: GAF domain-containing protein [Nitrospirota bacterium]|jgi:putative methionine-R-sulfoxide reductase with GAF domain